MSNKYLLDHLKPCLWLLALATICGVSYKWGMDSVRREAIGIGYAENKEGFAWKSRRLISQEMYR